MFVPPLLGIQKLSDLLLVRPRAAIYRLGRSPGLKSWDCLETNLYAQE